MIVSVIIPALNATATLPLQLSALAGQDFDGPWEILIADNGSTDDLAACVERCRAELDGLPECRIVDASRVAGAGYARTTALFHARGELLAFCDADDVVSPSWLAAIVDGLRTSDVVTGPIIEVTTAQLEAEGPEGLFRSLDGAGRTLSAQRGGGIWGGNSGLRRTALSGFAPDLMFLEDAAVARRATETGSSRDWIEEAIVLYRQPEVSSTSFRKGLGNGVGTVQLLREFPELGSALPHPIKSMAWIFLRAPGAVFSPRRAPWSRAVGRYTGVVLERILPGLYVGAIRASSSRRRRSLDAALEHTQAAEGPSRPPR
jgi:glycosyltransferase involved in cell wall biosynthesis